MKNRGTFSRMNYIELRSRSSFGRYPVLWLVDIILPVVSYMFYASEKFSW